MPYGHTSGRKVHDIPAWKELNLILTWQTSASNMVRLVAVMGIMLGSDDFIFNFTFRIQMIQWAVENNARRLDNLVFILFLWPTSTLAKQHDSQFYPSLVVNDINCGSIINK